MNNNFKLVIFILWIAIVTESCFSPKQQAEDLKLIAEVVKSKVALGEPIDIKLRIRNASSEPIIVVRPEINQRLHGWSLLGYITTPEGEEKIVEPTILRSLLRFLTKEDFVPLKPDQEIVIDIRFDSPVHRQYNSGTWQVHISPRPTDFFEVRNDIIKECFSKTGEYTVKFILESSVREYIEFDDKGHGRMVEIPDVWTGKIVSNKIKIKVK